MSSTKLRVALVGCGQIADAHLQEIPKTGCAEVVAVCDRQRDLAEQAAARFAVPGTFDDLGLMLESACPDVLHVATPPHTHAAIARRALEAGVHVYVEKPFTVDAAEAAAVLDAARRGGRLVCVGHDHLFDPAWEECRRRCQDGEFGRIVHVESWQGYDLTGPFGRLLMSDPDHWVHRLPGGLFHNVLSHPLYKITEFLPDLNPHVWATAFPGGRGEGFPSELRAFLRGEGVTAHLVFASQARPVLRVVRLYGTRASVEVDLDARVLRRTPPGSLPGPFGKIGPPLYHFREALGTLRHNVGRLLRSDLHFFAGMNRLFGLFYRAILDGGEPPIPYEEILRVTALMDDIFACCRREADGDTDAVPKALGNGSHGKRCPVSLAG